MTGGNRRGWCGGAGWMLAVVLLLAGLLGGAGPAAAMDGHRHGRHEGHGAVASQAVVTIPAASGVVAAGGSDHGAPQHHGHAPPPCCSGVACLIMHVGLPAADGLPLPTAAGRKLPLPAERLAEGLGVPPRLRPPRATV